MRKKILIVVPRLSNGGIEKVASTLSLNLGDDYEQYIFSLCENNDSYGFKSEPFTLDIPIGKNVFEKMLVSLKRLLILRKYMKENEIDVCISMGETCNILSLLTCTSVKKILTVHSQISIENKKKSIYGKIFSLLSSKIYNSADHIIAVSKIVKEDLVNSLKINSSLISIIYNGLDLDEINIKANENINIIQHYDLVSVGRITYAKGHWFLIRALSVVKKKHPSIKLNIIGSIENEKIFVQLNKMIKYYDLMDNIVFTGYDINPYKYIASSKFLVLSSVYEGFPCVVIEALSLGIPVITSNSGGATEMLLNGMTPNNFKKCIESNQIGVVTEHLGSDILFDEPISLAELSLANAIDEAITNYDNFDKKMILSKSNNYSGKSMANKYRKIIENV